MSTISIKMFIPLLGALLLSSPVALVKTHVQQSENDFEPTRTYRISLLTKKMNKFV